MLFVTCSGADLSHQSGDIVIPAKKVRFGYDCALPPLSRDNVTFWSDSEISTLSAVR
jgi:hypothetical protein